MIYDIIIIGAGPAGLTAAIYARRADKSVLIIEKNGFGGQMTYSPKIENFPDFDAVSGNELADKMTEQALALGAAAEIAEVTGVRAGDDDIKTVVCGETEYKCRALIIAAGAKHRLMGVPGEEDFIGEGVSFCAVCDGAFYRGMHVAVIGGGNSALQEALLLSDGCGRVTIVQNLDFLTGEKKLCDAVFARDNIDVIYGVTVASVNGSTGGDEGINGEKNKKLTSVTLNKNGGGQTELVCDGVFVAIGLAPDCGVFSSLSSLDEAGYIMSDESCYAETPGVFVAGDCRTKSVRQITTAAADGAVAALAACRYLS